MTQDLIPELLASYIHEARLLLQDGDTEGVAELLDECASMFDDETYIQGVKIYEESNEGIARKAVRP